MRLARILVTPELLRQVLHLPIATDIIRAGWDRDAIELVVSHPDLPDAVLQEGERPPLATPTFQSNPPVQFIAWNVDGQTQKA